MDEVVAKLKEQVARCKTARFKDDEATTWFEALLVLPRVDAKEVGSITKTLKAGQSLIRHNAVVCTRPRFTFKPNSV